MPARLLRFAGSRAAVPVIAAVSGVVLALIVGLSLALWYQTGQVGKYRDAATIASEALAAEIAQTAHLRARIEAQNGRIRELADAAAGEESRAAERARLALRARTEALRRSEAVPPGPASMNRWMSEAFAW